MELEGKQDCYGIVALAWPCKSKLDYCHGLSKSKLDKTDARLQYRAVKSYIR
jgi:hypothetical protein